MAGPLNRFTDNVKTSNATSVIEHFQGRLKLLSKIPDDKTRGILTKMQASLNGKVCTSSCFQTDPASIIFFLDFYNTFSFTGGREAT